MSPKRENSKKKTISSSPPMFNYKPVSLDFCVVKYDSPISALFPDNKHGGFIFLFFFSRVHIRETEAGGPLVGGYFVVLAAVAIIIPTNYQCKLGNYYYLGEERREESKKWSWEKICDDLVSTAIKRKFNNFQKNVAYFSFNINISL